MLKHGSRIKIRYHIWKYTTQCNHYRIIQTLVNDLNENNDFEGKMEQLMELFEKGNQKYGNIMGKIMKKLTQCIH